MYLEILDNTISVSGRELSEQNWVCRLGVRVAYSFSLSITLYNLWPLQVYVHMEEGISMN